MKLNKKFNLICFGYNPWSDFWKRNQIMVHYLAEKTYVDQVLFVNPSIWLEQVIKHPMAECTAFRLAYWSSIIPRNVERNIRAFTPVYLPKLAHITAKIMRNIIISYTRNPYILLVNTMIEIDVFIEDLFKKSSLSIFDWSDDFAQFASTDEEKKRTQNMIDGAMKRSHLVFTVNESLLQRALVNNPHSYCMRNATNLSMFPFSPINKKKIRKVIGYAGWLVPDRLDVELIHYCAASLPECDFVFVGPKVSKDPLCISQAPSNVRYYPPVKYSNLAKLIESFDICIIPNKLNSHTAGNDPIKIYDYLYMGKTIVSTMTAGVQDFQDVVYTCGSKEEFLCALRRALDKSSHTEIEARKKVGRANSWECRIEKLDKIIREKL